MKKNLMFIAAFMIPSIIFAQHRGKDHAQNPGPGEKMKAALSLDDAQYASIKGINKKYAGKYQLLRHDSTSGRDEKRAAMSTLRSERENEIKSVLTPEQKTKWETIRKARTEKRKENYQKGSEKYEKRMKSALSLSDDQFAKIQNADKEFRQKLTGLKKDGRSSGEKNKGEFKKLKAEHETAVKSILTDEQFKKWSDFRAKHKNRNQHKTK